jgi:hypothetical protein
MAKSQNPHESRENDQAETSQSEQAFKAKATVGVYNFFYEDYPAWIVFGEAKEILPFSRIIIGDDDDGSILIDKNVALTGLLHLMSHLATTVRANVSLATELRGFAMPVPGGPDHVLNIIKEIESELSQIRDMIKEKKIFSEEEVED